MGYSRCFELFACSKLVLCLWPGLPLKFSLRVSYKDAPEILEQNVNFEAFFENLPTTIRTI